MDRYKAEDDGKKSDKSFNEEYQERFCINIKATHASYTVPVNPMVQGNFYVLHIHSQKKSFKLYAAGLLHKAKGRSL